SQGIEHCEVGNLMKLRKHATLDMDILETQHYGLVIHLLEVEHMYFLLQRHTSSGRL
nr:hypothetical protein [Tanacetum cinerariifolium]